jgi:hypothetical protein
VIFSWVSFALALLKFVNNIMIWARERELISEGQREEIARAALAIAEKVHTRDEILAKVKTLSNAELDAELRGLEPD